METRRNFLILFLIFLFPTSVFGYSAQTTHPALADESVDFFNKSYTRTISDSEKGLIIQGAIGEDQPATRVVNHFHDPVYDRGLTSFLGISSVKWATGTKYQAEYLNPSGITAGVTSALFSSDTDYSWERSIYEYVHGDEERGLVGLGHTLHLVHDLTVPPHTRNDPHPPAFDFGSPYEEWTSKFTPNNTDIISELSNRGPILLGKIEDYFDSVARYTNANFFSKDTILSGEYYTPVYSIVGVGMLSSGEMQSFGLAKIENQSYKLFELRENESFSGENIKLYLINDKKKEPVLSDYWNMLSKQAVLNGAGVIKLFFDEVEKEKETLALYYKNQSWLGKLLPKMFEPKYTKGDISPRQNLAAVSEIFKDSETDELEEEIVLEEDVDDKENNKLRLAEEIIIPVTQLQGMSPPLSSTPDLGGAIIEEHCVPPDPNCVPGFET